MIQIKPSSARFIVGLFTCLTAWFAVILQLYLNTETTANFFSYFTILTNLLIAVSLLFNLLFPSSGPGKFFSSLSVETAIALYIFIVGIVYNTVLRGLVTLEGWNSFVNNLLHVVVPVLYLLYWYIFVPKGRLEIKQGFYWLIYPAAYLVYSLIRGSIVHWYPYPFLNALKFGYQQVSINIVIMLAIFLVIGFLFIALKRKRI